MYIERRWLIPVALNLLLLGALAGIVFVLVGSEAPRVAPAALPIATAQGQPPAPEEMFDITTSGSDTTQNNTRGFGDIGLQFQDVTISSPITVVHISNQGNNNSTNVNLAKDGRIVSEQEGLESARSDGTGGSSGGSSP